MSRGICIATLMVLIAACDDGGDSIGAVEATTRDSSGIAVVEYPADALDRAPVWQLSQSPLAVIGADENDSTVDLSTSMLGTLLPDGGVVLVTAQPAEVLRFDAAGNPAGMIGRQGAGPGEYRFVMSLLRLGGDTLFIFDAGSRKGMLFPAGGGPMIDDIEVPVPSDRPFPPIIRGRMQNGVFIHSGESLIPTPPPGASGFYRLPVPIFGRRASDPAYDTLFTTEGAMSYASSVTVGDTTFPISRPVVFGPVTQIGVGTAHIWHSLADRFEVDKRDTAGKVSSILRVAGAPRPVDEASKEKYKVAAREGLERMKALMPPGLLESELKKVDETVFAENFAAIGQLAVDDTDALWVTAGSAVTDSVTKWAVFSADGRLQGTVVVPEGQLLGANASRIVIRREDESTGVVRIEVWGLNRGPATAGDTAR